MILLRNRIKSNSIPIKPPHPDTVLPKQFENAQASTPHLIQ